METIMVQMSDEDWTMEAMHLACAMTRNLNGRLVLLYVSPAQHPALLGCAITPPSAEEQERITAYTHIAEDYGVPFYVQPVQYVSISEAIGQATEMLNGAVLFANIPLSAVPFWRRLHLWNMRRHIGSCRLYTLAQEPPLSMPGVALPVAQH